MGTRKNGRRLVGRVAKQALEQTLHFAMALASVWVVAWPIQRWTQRPMLSVGCGLAVSALWLALREYGQWPSKRWWDPILDGLFQAAGLVTGGVTFLIAYLPRF